MSTVFNVLIFLSVAQYQRSPVATTSSRGGYRPAPSPYADPRRLPPPTAPQAAGTSTTATGLAGRISPSPHRPASASAASSARRARNPRIFDRLSAGLASVERPGERRGAASPMPAEPPSAPSSTTWGGSGRGSGGGRGRRQRPAWARGGENGNRQGNSAGGDYASESEAAQLAEVLNGQRPPASPDGGQMLNR